MRATLEPTPSPSQTVWPSPRSSTGSSWVIERISIEVVLGPRTCCRSMSTYLWFGGQSSISIPVGHAPAPRSDGSGPRWRILAGLTCPWPRREEACSPDPDRGEARRGDLLAELDAPQTSRTRARERTPERVQIMEPLS